MTTVHDSLDLDLGTARKSRWTLTALWQAFVSLRNRYRNRRQVYDLSHFDDHILEDIGLNRSEVQHALRGGPFTDHSPELVRCALLRRSRLYIV